VADGEKRGYCYAKMVICTMKWKPAPERPSQEMKIWGKKNLISIGVDS
jgi:hypothetical protein